VTLFADRFRRHKFILSLVCLFLIFAGHNLGFLAGFAGDELRYRSAAWEIFSGGPQMNLEHPLLSKTLQGVFAGLTAMLGFDPIVGMRVPSLLAGAGALAATYAIALRFLSARAAVLAALLLFSNTLLWVHARMISPEMVSLGFLLAALYFFLADRISGDRAAIGLAGAALGLSLSAKWIGVWLVPWALARLAVSRAWKKSARFLAGMIVFYVIGNGAYFLNHAPLDLFQWQWWALHYHQTSEALSPHNGSPAWTWFAVPQHLYYARLMPDPQAAEVVMGAMNLLVFALAGPAIWIGARSGPAGRLILEAALCLYVPWMFVARPTYFFYVLTVLPLVCLLEAVCLDRLWDKYRRAAGALPACALVLFMFFYPAAVGMRIGVKYERCLAALNFYKRPVFDSMFCQKCNLFFERGVEISGDYSLPLPPKGGED